MYNLFLKGRIIMTAVTCMDEIKNMSNVERNKLLGMLFDEYFDNRPPRDVIEDEKIKSAWGDDE